MHDHHHTSCCQTEPVLLRGHGLGVSYGADDWAIRGIDLEIHPRQIISLIGPNGAGKSSLLRVLAGLLKPNEGRVERMSSSPLRIGYVPQQQTLDRSLPVSVEEFLGLKLQTDRWWWSGVSMITQEKVQHQLAEIGADHLAQRKLGELSGGELQRVMIAFSLVDQPQILLLDEPMTGVDVKGGTDFQLLLQTLKKSRGLAVVMVSHDLHMVGAISDVVLCLNRHLCCSGTPAHVLQDHVLAGIYGAKLGLPQVGGTQSACC